MTDAAAWVMGRLVAGLDACLACLVFHDKGIPVHNRFQIEDLIIQDATGVVFRAIDAQTGMAVAVRRFFPFGAAGGGLESEEVTAYKIAIERLAGLKHPALRSVICGGCDPVDGMPFIATEWIEGDAIDAYVRQEPLPAAVAAQLLTQALEVSELLSQVLAEEAVWVETDLKTIILGNEASGRGFTFWISPLKWLGGLEQARGLRAIATLAEEVLDWSGRVVGDQAGGGLGAWLKWLRGAADTASLREARENLAAALGENPPPPATELVVTASRPITPRKSKTPLLLACGCTLIAIGIGGWLVTRHRMPRNLQGEVLAKLLEDSEKDAQPAKQSPVTGTSMSAVNQRQAELAAKAAEKRRELAAKEMELAGRGGVFTPSDGDLLALHKGKTETLEGKVAGTGVSSSGKTLYLHFSPEPSATEPRGALRFSGVDESDAKAWVGKNVRLRGRVEVEDERPQILVTDPKGIEVK
jgi:hypothetical protein